MSVDLDRLREAYKEAFTPSEKGDTFATIGAAVNAVLDAPTVWWCANRGTDDPMFCDERTGDHSGCGWVALVPVKGGQE